MSSVTVSHVSREVSVSELQEFFSFCGALESVNQVESSDAAFLAYQLNFAQEKALETALLLNDAELKGVPVKVEEVLPPSYDSYPSLGAGDHKVQLNTDAKPTGDRRYDDIAQEEKPKSAILAQLLAAGYKVSDDLISKAISVDRRNGYSNKFVSFLTDLDSKYLHLQDPESATARNLSRAQSLLSLLSNQVQSSSYLQKLQNYFERSLNSPYGIKVHDFYRLLSKEVADVHNEAKRLVELQKTDEGKSSGQSSA